MLRIEDGVTIGIRCKTRIFSGGYGLSPHQVPMICPCPPFRVKKTSVGR